MQERSLKIISKVVILSFVVLNEKIPNIPNSKHFPFVTYHHVAESQSEVYDSCDTIIVWFWPNILT